MILTDIDSSPELYIRTNITKNAKGDYQHETTVSVTIIGDDTARAADLLAELNQLATELTYDEIKRRKYFDDREAVATTAEQESTPSG